MDIRLLTENDIPRAAAIVGINYTPEWEANATDELHGMFSNAPIRPLYYVAEEAGKIIGFAGFIQSWMDYAVYEIFWVNVLPEKQGQGIGNKIFSRIIETIRHENASALILLTATEKNARYYAKHFNFVVLQTIGDYSLMSLSLASKDQA